jgi:peptidoglycan/xylan/chitin deacetylase (PgdA/CDA1 family)
MPQTQPVNGFSVDVEDWYQVADFAAVLGFDQWDQYESRVAANTDRVLQLLEQSGGVKGTFFILTWNAIPRSSGGSPARATK